MTVTAKYSNRSTLTVQGDALSNAIDLSRNAAGSLFVNGGAVPVVGGSATTTQTRLIQITGGDGDDALTLNESNGALPKATLSGGNGNDTMTGGSGDDLLLGDAGNDTLFGKAGVDLMHGGDGNDVLTGGDGNDFVNGNAGDDRLIWNPGDDTDVFEGGTGIDTAEVNGGNGAEVFTMTANASRVRFDRVSPAPFSIDAGTMEAFVVSMNGGDDSFSASGNLAALVGVTVDGGSGNDNILGSNGADRLFGGDDNDFIDGQQGADIAFLGAGDDVFQWDPGDGSDVVEGQGGSDTMLFNGSNAAEVIALSANGGRATFFRNIANVTMDLNGTETIRFNALGSADAITVNDLTGTDVAQVDVDLAGTVGGTSGDGAADAVTARGTGAGDVVDVFGAGSSVSVLGLAARVNVTNSEGANDALLIVGLAGDDRLTATTLPAGVIGLTLDGGAGNDVLLGSQGADVLLGGDDDDFVFGDNGNDTAFLGTGADVFQWDPGDGNDVIEGQDGVDKMLFFGSNAAETINIVANGARVLFQRDVANVTMDLNDTEQIEFRALGGTDQIVIGDLTGTDATRIDVDLRGAGGGGDGAADTLTASGSNGADVFGVFGDAGGITVFGLQASVNAFFFDASDRLTLNAQGGDDVVDASGLGADGMLLTMNGGLGNDLFIGGEGDDLINGGDGSDLALMGAGDDTFVWNPGDDNDTLEGQGGSDTMRFNGANIAETITISANGGRAIFVRNVANVVMDLNDTETIRFNALGGADTVTVNDLTGTDVSAVEIDLAASGGGGDGAADTVIVNASNGDDVVVVVGNGSSVSIIGLAATINLVGFEAGLDRIVVNLLGGADVLEASDLEASGPLLTGNGGDGDDVLVGGDGNDTLTGGADDDVLIGGPGIDVLDGGPGDNVVIQLVGLSGDPAAIF